MDSIMDLAHALSKGRVTSEELTEAALARIDAPDGEGSRAFTKLYRDSALACAKSSDLQRASGVQMSPLSGLPISIKDLFDVAGEVTLAGSIVRRNQPPAVRDAVVVSRLRQAGAVIVGKTGMSEFAFSGLGLNPHYGTPRNPWDRSTGRIPGGSTSGGAVSVTDGMAVATVGTDTGGSLRIPAAFCGLVGFKPTASRVPRDGAFPLSQSLDSIGPMGPTVRCCAILDAVMAGIDLPALDAFELKGLRVGVVQDYVLDGVDSQVAQSITAAVSVLAKAGAHVVEVRMPQLARIPEINRQGGLIAAEAYAIHQQNIDTPERAASYDQRIVARIRRGQDISAAGYIGIMQERAALNRELDAIADDFDVLLMPTVAVIPPKLAPLESDDALFLATNGLVLRNTTVINFMDGCALSLPCHAEGDAPVGLMLAATNGNDHKLLRIGVAIETLLNRHRSAS
jgi:aspartyl-tRNA(Asn)/glutamyl-tRNA(Gln) amidotransferase subunit A